MSQLKARQLRIWRHSVSRTGTRSEYKRQSRSTVMPVQTNAELSMMPLRLEAGSCDWKAFGSLASRRMQMKAIARTRNASTLHCGTLDMWSHGQERVRYYWMAICVSRWQSAAACSSLSSWYFIAATHIENTVHVSWLELGSWAATAQNCDQTLPSTTRRQLDSTFPSCARRRSMYVL